MSRLAHVFGRVAAAVTATIVAWAAPLQAQTPNCAPFTDVAASSGFCGNIQWLFNRGITQGCTATQYCPANFVRRDQMAAFLNRLADNLFPLSCAAGQVMKWNGTSWACAGDATGPANAFVQGGNAFGTTASLGTNDAQALQIEAGSARVMRYEPGAVSPNVIGGSPANNATSGVRGATIGGGGVPAGDTDPDFIDEGPNRVTDAYGTVAGGYANVAGDDAGLVLDNTFATVGGGRRNTASGGWSTVAGGRQNTASNVFSTIPGGFRNTASGWGSFAAGFDARADQDQCFVFSNWSITQQGPDTWGSCLGLPNIVRFFADRGLSVHFHTRLLDGSGDQWVYFGDFFAGRMIATSSGAHLTDTGMWTNASDRALKDGFAAVDTQAVLESVVKLPVARWHYRRDGPVVEHIGPTAQDFHAAFGLGRNDTTIGTVDADGVALAAIQGLNAKLEAKLAARDVEVAALVFELRSLRDELASLRARLPPDAQPR